MSFSSFSATGPVVGIGDGTLLVGWPCRPKDSEPNTPFNLAPVMLWHGSASIAWVVTMDPHGNIKTQDVESLQFDPKWKRHAK